MTVGPPIPVPAFSAPALAGPSRSTTDGYVGRLIPTTQGAAIAVGFDAGGAGTSALLWAVEEADRTARELRLVSASAHPVSSLGHHTWRREVTALVRHLALTGLGYSLGSGPAVDVLLAAAADASLLVVGRQGGGHIGRSVGGTAAKLARQSPIPLVVVPQQWSQASTFNAPVLVAWPTLDEVEPDGGVRESGALWFAVERATRYRVPLMIVSGWRPSPPSSASVGASPAESSVEEGHRAGRLDAFRASHPGIEIASRSLSGSTDAALVELSDLAQLVVVARPMTGSDPAADGAVAHLLRRSGAPVAIIPPLP